MGNMNMGKFNLNPILSWIPELQSAVRHPGRKTGGGPLASAGDRGASLTNYPVIESPLPRLQFVPIFRSLIASKSWTPPPTRLVV